MLPRRASGALTAVLTATLFLTACGSSQDATSAPTGSDTPLVVYSGRDEELVAPLIEKFEAASGVDVQVRYAGSTELAAQLLEEKDKTPAQVFLAQDSGSLGAVAQAGMFTALPADLTAKVPAQYTSTDGSWVGLTGRARVIAYDSASYEADEVPDDVFELTEPAWKGKVGIAPSNASFQSFVTAMRVVEGEERTAAWLKGLVDNDAQIFSGNSELLEAVNSGALDLALINHYYWARSEQDPTTLRAQLRFGKPGSVSALVNVTGVGVLTGAKDDPQARQFVQYLLSQDGQRYFLDETFEYPLVSGIGSPANVPSLTELDGPDVNLSDLSSVQQTVDAITSAGLL